MQLIQLPTELLFHIESYLSQSERAKLCSVNQQFRDICTEPLHSYGCNAALMWSAQKGMEETARLALKYGANINSIDKYHRSALQIAARYNKISIARILIDEGANVSAVDSEVLNPLHMAVLCEHVDIARLLLRHGADVTEINESRETVLHNAAGDGNVQIMEMLLEYGADVGAISESGRSTLYTACENGHYEAAKLLRKHGVDPNKAGRSGHNTPLHVVAGSGYLNIVELLLGEMTNVDPDVQDSVGKTPLHDAARGGHLQVVEYLVEWGANGEALDARNVSSLMFAINDNHTAVAKYLIEEGKVDVCHGDVHGETPLYKAVREGNIEITESLLRNGAVVGVCTTYFKDTPLHLVCQLGKDEGKLEIAKLLVEYGADVYATTKDGESPLDIAMSMDHEDMVRYLEEKGCLPTPKRGT